MTDLRPAQYFSPDYGLMARRAADAVLSHQPLTVGPDGGFWGYSGGLWSPAAKEVSTRIVTLLGDRYRPRHKTAIVDVLHTLVDDLGDPKENKINMVNGMAHWDGPNGVEVLQHHEAYRSKTQLPVRYVVDSACPEFDAFLDASVAPDDVLRLWEMIGYLMYWGNPLQRLFLLTGGGGNGKGVVLNVLKALLGLKNMSTVPLHSFITDRFASADLFGKLANICGDIDTTYIEQTGRIKELAGEDHIRAEHKGERAFTFRFDGKSIFSANGIPGSVDASVGWTRRWEVVLFPNAPAKPDRGLVGRLVQQRSLEGIARKAIDALRGLMARGDFARGPAADAVHEEFAQRSNKVLQWLNDPTLFTRDPSGWYDRRELLKQFRMWDGFENPAARSMGSQTFYDRMRAIPWVRDVTRRGVRGFAGFRRLTDVAYGEIIEIAPSEGVQNGEQLEIGV